MVSCRGLVTDEMTDCIVQLHCMTGCDANSGFYGKGKMSLYVKMANSPVARRQLSRCGDDLAMEEDVVEELFRFTRDVVYFDKKSTSMAEARAVKWKSMKNKSFIRLPPDEDSLRQHYLRANYLAYSVSHHSLKNHPSPLDHGWELVGGRCRPVRHTQPALPVNIPAPGQDDESESYDEGDNDSSESEGSEYSVAESSDSDWSNLFDTKLQNIIVLPTGDI